MQWDSRQTTKGGGGGRTAIGSWSSDFSFVCYPVMIILASKPQIWPCFAMGGSINGDRAALPWLRSLSEDKLVGNENQVHGAEDTLSAVTGGQLGRFIHGKNIRLMLGLVEICF